MKTFKQIIAAVTTASVLAGLFSACNAAQKTAELSQTLCAYTTGNTEYDKILSDGKIKKTVRLEQNTPLELTFSEPTEIDTVILRETGDSADWFKIEAMVSDEWQTVYESDRILAYHPCWFEPVTAQKLRITVEQGHGAVSLQEVSAYKGQKREKPMCVSQYLRFDTDSFEEMCAAKDPGFSGYYDVVTDVLVFGEISLDENANVVFEQGEAVFAQKLAMFREVIGERNVKIRATVFFDRNDANGARSHDATKDFVNQNIDKISAQLKATVEKYALDGLDFDWEFPSKAAQWKAYDKLVIETAAYTSVSVALPPWGIRFSKEAMKKIDLVNLMAYDLFDGRGDHSNIYICGAEAIEKVHKAGFAYEKILLGIPTYGRTTNKSGNAWPEYRNFPGLGKWDNKIENFEYTEDGVQKTCDAYVDSFAESRDKTALAADMGCGIMIFRAMCDAPYTYEYSIHKGIGEVVENRT